MVQKSQIKVSLFHSFESHLCLNLNMNPQKSVRNDERDHPFKTSAFFRGRGVKNWPNWPTDSSKKLPTGGG